MAICDVASPNTRRCSPSHRVGSCQAWAIVPTTKHLPVPAGPTRDSTLGAGGQHAADGGGLVDAELDPGLAQLAQERRRELRGDPGAVRSTAAARSARSVRTCSSVAYRRSPGRW